MNVQRILALLFAAGLACASTLWAARAPRKGSGPLYLVIGSYAPAADEGIRVMRFDPDNATATPVSGLSGIDNPSYLIPNAKGDRVYAVGENDAGHSTANALAFERPTGRLTLLDSQPTHGAAPCHLALSPDERFLVTANYGGGSLTTFRVSDEGTLEPGTELRFHGQSIVRGRQDEPHVHFIWFTPDRRYLLADDLGTDRIHRFTLNAPGSDSLFDAASRCDIALRAGTGPRHGAFAPGGRMAYVVTELSGEVIALSYRKGELKPVAYAVADTLHAIGSADIHLSPDGRFVYASNRLRGDGVAIFRVDGKTGLLTRVGYQPTGRHPRNFVLSPDGRYLLVACRDDDRVEIYRRNARTGLLTDTGQRITMPRPVCLQWIVP